MSVDLFALKAVPYQGRAHQVIVQNENGPCPLVAVANILLLTQRMKLDASTVAQRFILLADLVHLVADVVLRASSSTSSTGTEERNQLVSSVFELLPKLARGLDLNIRFTGPSAMEFTEELSIFDALGISIVHGWLVDPVQQKRFAEALGTKSYNQIMYDLVSADAGEEKSDATKAIEEFLSESASQLTYAGLTELHAAVREREMAVLFRNNHFSTLYRHEGDLYLLVTDAGFADQERVVWERLDSIDGDTEFHDGSFRPVSQQQSAGSPMELAPPTSPTPSSKAPPPTSTSAPPPASPLALNFDSVFQSLGVPVGSAPPPAPPAPPAQSSAAAEEEEEASLKLALRLEAEEREAADLALALALDRQDRQQQQQQQQQQYATTRQADEQALQHQHQQRLYQQLPLQQQQRLQQQYQQYLHAETHSQQSSQQWHHLSYEEWLRLQQQQQQQRGGGGNGGGSGDSSSSCTLS